MSHRTGCNRRHFLKGCLSCLALAACDSQESPRGEAGLREYQRVTLVDPDDRPLRAGDLRTGETYVFAYPFRSTPCFLLDLGQPLPGGQSLQTADGRTYQWRGGVCPQQSVVAYSAICSHKLTYPDPRVSFIDYREQSARYIANDDRTAERKGVIYCCSENSVYDPAAGARVLGGPAPQPLAAILLEQDGRGRLQASGVYGGAGFNRFFERFGYRLDLGGARQARAKARGTARAVPIGRYTQRLVHCG